MSETDTRDSLPSDTPSGQDPGGHAYDTPSSTAPESPAAPDPHEVKAQGDGSAAEKDSAQWVTGEEPMTGPQASYLETLAHQAGEPVPEGLTKAGASDEIERLQSAGAGGTAGGASEAGAVERPTDEWVTGEEPMTGPQASYLETLAQQAGTTAPTGLTKSQASRAIDELRARASG